jgi:hypothetical protein
MTSEAMEKTVGELICRLNPYTHEMDIYVGNPKPNDDNGNPCQVELEIDDKYPGEWSFKGEPQRINRSIRLRYRYPVRDKEHPNTILYWVNDYLLIGYEGAGGGV